MDALRRNEQELYALIVAQVQRVQAARGALDEVERQLAHELKVLAQLRELRELRGQEIAQLGKAET